MSEYININNINIDKEKLLISAILNGIWSIGLAGSRTKFFDYSQLKTHANFVKDFVMFFGLTSIFSCITTLTDKYANQEMTSSKPMQYGILVAEIVLGTSLTHVVSKNKSVIEYFKGLSSTNFSHENSIKYKAITAGAIYVSLVHKYIWDQPNDTNVELDQNSGIPIDILGAEI